MGEGKDLLGGGCLVPIEKLSHVLQQFHLDVIGELCEPFDFVFGPFPIPLGLAASLSWFELGQLEFSSLSLFCAPLLAISRAVSLLTMQRAFVRCSENTSSGRQGHLEQFCLYYTGLNTLALLVPALISYANSHVEALMSLSFLFMSSNLYSDLWLGLSLNGRAYATLDHTKYLAASIGQWLIQNMAHPNVVAFGGKVLTIACLARIAARS
ncbi:unnamed protein product [Heligmosomoides polygyrus]|uniref:DUF1751 domain-containing protein n=1 Tax=Heligmosomoides polygyrus TaxID=6339 RepID=A0A183G3V5_HELPZ|nr:unnamed protein product [Heligmosomoides polygyrus]